MKSSERLKEPRYYRHVETGMLFKALTPPFIDPETFHLSVKVEDRVLGEEMVVPCKDLVPAHPLEILGGQAE